MISTVALDTQVIEKGLCVNCGACQGLCPYWKSIDGRTLHCFDCDREDGRCVRFCPRMPFDKDALREKFFGGETIVPEIGPFRGLYLTRAKNREGCQHGGTMTALVTLALEEGFIDGAILAKSKGGLEPEGVLAETPEEIRSCAGSSFQIPPTLAVLNQALEENRCKKLGIVGTPCKTLAVYKMKDEPFAENNHHAENISMVFGLFCGWGLDWKGLQALAEQETDTAALRHTDILPSKYHSMTFNDKEVDLDRVLPLVRETCKTCGDMTAEFADISVGGARSADGWDVDKEWNQVIVRTEKGQRLLDLARERGVLEFKEVPEGNLEKLKKASQNKKDKAR